MSYSITVKGTQEDVRAKLAEYSTTLGDSDGRKEFDGALPAILLLLDQNVNNGNVSVEAYGHATFDRSSGHKTQGNCGVVIRGQVA